MKPKSDVAPVIVVRRVKKVAAGHHGGSWKVAYADFVTAMMAFFLLMWLLGSVDQDTRERVSGYFKRPLSAVFTEGPNPPGGDRILAQSSGSTRRGILSPGEEATRFEAMERDLEREIKADPQLRALEGQLSVDLTREGLRVRLEDSEAQPMFASGSTSALPYARHLLRRLVPVLGRVPNPIVIVGHTDALPYGGTQAGYTNWELSTERANTARRELVAGGFPAGRVQRVEGLADTRPLDVRNPLAPRNRRVEIIVLKGREAEKQAGRHDGFPSL